MTDSISEEMKDFYELRYLDTVRLVISKNGELVLHGNSSNLGLDFMTRFTHRKLPIGGMKKVDTIIVNPYLRFEDDSQKFDRRLHALEGKEGVAGDPTFDYYYLLNYYTIKDSLYVFRDIQKQYKDYFFDQLLTSSKQLPVGYILETPDFQLTRELIKIEYDDSVETIKLNRRLRKSIPK